MKKETIGVIGSGAFGSIIAMLLSHSNQVLIYARRSKIIDSINQHHYHRGIRYKENVTATNDAEDFCRKCTIIFPVVPSKSFAEMIRSFAPYLKPYHILIHGTKGFDLIGIDTSASDIRISRKNVRTMSEVIVQETAVRRVGCLAGPNIAAEIQEGFPTAAVIASEYDEVFNAGKRVLSNDQFFIFLSYDTIGAELAGALKNIIALGSGILCGKGMGKNIQAMLITRGLREMISFGQAMGSHSRAFLGTAGIGDLIATATSSKSRNYSVGKRLATGEQLDDIIQSMDEVVEGLRTLQIAHQLALYYNIQVPITQLLYKIVFEQYDINTAITFLMRYPYSTDVDFL